MPAVKSINCLNIFISDSKCDYSAKRDAVVFEIILMLIFPLWQGPSSFVRSVSSPYWRILTSLASSDSVPLRNRTSWPWSIWSTAISTSFSGVTYLREAAPCRPERGPWVSGPWSTWPLRSRRGCATWSLSTLCTGILQQGKKSCAYTTSKTRILCVLPKYVLFYYFTLFFNRLHLVLLSMHARDRLRHKQGLKS